jgi:hypothetical protein
MSERWLSWELLGRHDEGAYRAFWAERNRGKALSKGGPSAESTGGCDHEDRPDSGS